MKLPILPIDIVFARELSLLDIEIIGILTSRVLSSDFGRSFICDVYLCCHFLVYIRSLLLPLLFRSFQNDKKKRIVIMCYDSKQKLLIFAYLYLYNRTKPFLYFKLLDFH